jgi:putative transposase
MRCCASASAAQSDARRRRARRSSRVQSVKTTEQGGPQGYDGGTKVNGRKRHSLVDPLGLLLKVVVHPAHVHDRAGAKLVLAGLCQQFPHLRHLWADQADTGPILDWIREELGWTVEVVERSPRRGFVGTPDGEFHRVNLPAIFEPLPRRWVVERTLAWTSRYRRMSKSSYAAVKPAPPAGQGR